MSLALYKRKRLRAPHLRYSVYEKYGVTSLWGATIAVSMHYYNWIWFKQKHIYENDGPEKDKLWRQNRGEEFYRHWNLATNILGLGAFAFAVVKFRRKFIFSPRGGNPIWGFWYFFSANVIEYGWQLPMGMVLPELIYYGYHRYDLKRAENLANAEQISELKTELA